MGQDLTTLCCQGGTCLNSWDFPDADDYHHITIDPGIFKILCTQFDAAVQRIGKVS